jgi:hypothetical protein
MKKSLLTWLIIWAVIAVIVSIIGYSKILPGIALAAFISLIFLFKTLNDHWSGEVIDVKNEEVYNTDNDGNSSSDTVEFAYIKLANGKTKRTQNPGWKIGNKLEKRKGEATIRVLK